MRDRCLHHFADNQRTGAPQGQPAESYVYDGSGNPAVYRNVNLTYDSGNHVTSYGTTTPILSLYGAEGLRRKKTVGSTSTWYVYDGADPVFELNANGSLKATNVFGANGLVSRRVNGVTSFYAFDPMGHAANLVNSAGSVLYNCGYDAYGQPYGNATMLTYGYGAQHGYYRDSEAAYADNLLLCTNRWYDPSTARWLTRDPIGYEGGSNLYGYVGGNPVGGVDPSGLRSLTSLDIGRLKKLYAAGAPTNLINGAVRMCKSAIASVPNGSADPANLRALWWAIDELGSHRYEARDFYNRASLPLHLRPGPKCNLFAADAYAQGAGVGYGGNGVPTKPYKLGMNRPFLANELSDISCSMPNFPPVSIAALGDIIAFHSSTGLGHTTLKLGPSLLIYASGGGAKIGCFDDVKPRFEGFVIRTYAP